MVSFGPPVGDCTLAQDEIKKIDATHNTAMVKPSVLLKLTIFKPPVEFCFFLNLFHCLCRDSALESIFFYCLIFNINICKSDT
jgi:hypothetical protein